MFIRSLIKYAFRSAASDPKVRAKAAKVARRRLLSSSLRVIAILI